MFALTRFTLEIKTTADTDVLDITDPVNQAVKRSGTTAGLLNLFIAGSTAALTTIEYESGAVHDLKAAIERLVPRNLAYAHDARWGDGNGYSHVRAAFMKPSLSIPIADRRLQLGTWQQIVLLDFDNRPRNRQIQGHIMGISS